MNDGESWPMVSSYKCSWIRGVTDEQFEIYPRRGEIWALYKDWSLHEWAHNPSFVKECKFELVEILTDFSKYLGADGACLVQVDGFRSIFERQKIGGSHVTFHISLDNLYIFSHNVPAYRFKEKSIKLLMGCLSLINLPCLILCVWRLTPKRHQRMGMLVVFLDLFHLEDFLP